MKRNRIFWLAAAALLLIRPLTAETISFKFAYSLPSIREGDINAWMSSFNTLWADWQAQTGGELSGEFPSLDYQPSYEVEIRIPIAPILAFSISASRLQSSNNGTISFTSTDGSQIETHFISNQVNALPVKLGFCLLLKLPRLPLTAVVSGGRHITFVRYKTSEDYSALFKTTEQDYDYWYSKTNTYNSESLGFYASVALELSVLRYLSLVVEGEQVWSKAAGFKGPYTFENYLGENASGKASLYYYSSDQFGLGKTYPLLAGHKSRPEENVSALRQGELNFGGISLRVGLRLKF
jgi:hypothetical protein